jgi:spermidine synthase
MTTFLLFGFYSLLAQVLLLREIAQIFSAHEFSLAAGLAWWLLWTAAGAALARSRPRPDFANASLLFCVVAVLNLLLARVAPGLLPPLYEPGLFAMLAGPALLCLPAGLLNGFAAGAALGERPAFFYAAEAAGAAAAGLLSAFHSFYFPGVQGAWLLAGAGTALAALRLFPAPFTPRRLGASAAAALTLAGAALLAPRLWTLMPPAPKPAAVAETSASRLAFAGELGTSVYEDGRLVHTPRDPSYAEELVHLPLLALPKPGPVLLHGAGAFFAAAEVLKHRPSSVEVAEPDRFKAAALAALRPPWGEVKTIFSDIRLLAGRDGRYLAVIHAGAPPENAAQNRFYTAEYFLKVRSLLAPGGLLVFQLPFAENYVPQERAYAAACILAAARTVFPHVETLPGARLTVLASASPLLLREDLLAARYGARRIKSVAVVPSAFPFLLDPYRRGWAAAALEKVKSPPPNTDLNPVAYFRFWRAWLSMVMSPGAMLGLAALALAAAFIAWPLSGALKFTSEERSAEAFLVGFWALAFETAVLLAFQSRTGRLSPELGAMFALFMAGAAGGAAMGNAGSAWRVLLAEAGAAALAFAAAWRPELAQAPWGARGLLLSGGFFSGMFFAAAAGRCGVRIYAWDLLGGAAGGLAAAAFIVPLAGISGGLLAAGLAAAAALAGGSAVLILRKRLP